MAVVYYPIGSNLGTRTVGNGFVETLLSVSPNVILYFDTGSNINNISASLFYITASNSVSSSYSATASYMDTDLQGWWKFNDGSGSGVTDSSIYKKHGLILGTGYSWITNSYVGSNSSALSLTTTSWVSFGTKIHMLGDLSLSIWTKKISTDGNYPGIIGNYQQNNNGILIYVDLNSGGAIGFEISDGTTTVIAGSLTSITGSWHHLVGVIDRNKNLVTVYMDGAIQTSASCASVGYNETPTYWTINCRNDGGYNNHGTLYVDDARVYSKVLTQADITALYSGGPQ